MKKEKKITFITKILSPALIIIIIIFMPLLGCREQIEEAPEVIIEETEVLDEETEVLDEEETKALDEEAEVETEEKEEKEEEISDNINMLSGLELSGNIQNTRPLAIMVQNSPKARPHSGLIKADIIFEAVAEAGITRFVVLFSSHDAEIIGPVRSARIYFAEIARSFDPVYTFWGTYPQAYDAIKEMDMDVLDANSTAYVNYTTAGWRDSTRSNALEHTAFIDTYGIKEDALLHGYSLEGGQSLLEFKLDAPYQQREDISEIIVDFSYDQYKSVFSYDINSNEYLKSLAGEPHVDFESGQQLSLNNVIVMITDIDGPVSDAGHMVVRTTGKHQQGKAYYFMDGGVIEGTWGRESIFDPFEFHDSQGNQMKFNRGQTWINIIQSLDRVSF